MVVQHFAVKFEKKFPRAQNNCTKNVVQLKLKKAPKSFPAFVRFQRFFVEHLPIVLSVGYLKQGCQMVYFQTKNPTLVKFWRVLNWKLFGIFYSHLELNTAIWYIL
jgi:hypothetical protein